jgi:large subunit ribosomal protein L6
VSRIGKKPVMIPAGVKVLQKKQGDMTQVQVEGPRGKMSLPFRPEVAIAIDGQQVRVQRQEETPFASAYHGTVRSLIANMVHGVTQGFRKSLEIVGVGYQAKLEGKKLVLQVGFSHPVTLEVPEGIKVELPKQTTIVINGADKQLVGEFAATVRKIRPPEPYKGKGIRYSDEQVVRKAGKAFGSGE